MHSSKEAAEYYCKVCGLADDFPIWGEDGATPSFAICSCCGVEFGYEDITPELIRAYRQQWLDAGAKWFTPRKKPSDWNLEEQLRNVPTRFR